MTIFERRVLELALIGLQTERGRIDEEMADIRKRLGHASAALSSSPKAASVAQSPTRLGRQLPNKKRRMTAAQRRKISQAMKARWAAAKHSKAA
jgi:hypothetical protein